MKKYLFSLFIALTAVISCKKDKNQKDTNKSELVGEWIFSGFYNEIVYDNSGKKIGERTTSNGGAKFNFNANGTLIIKDVVFDKEINVNGHYRLGYIHVYNFLGNSTELQTTIINYSLNSNKLDFDGDSFDFKWISKTQFALTKTFMDTDEYDKPIKFVQIFNFVKK